MLRDSRQKRFLLLCFFLSFFLSVAISVPNCVNRRATFDQLLTVAKPQSFVVRPSSQAGQYSLSMTDEVGTIIHALIEQDDQSRYFISGAPDPYPTIAQRERNDTARHEIIHARLHSCSLSQLSARCA